MNRFLTIPEEDITADPVSAGRLILHATRRNLPFVFQSIVPLGDTILVVLAEPETSSPVAEVFVFSPFHGQSADGVAAEINCREEAGMHLLSAFFLGSALWGLYGRFDEDETMA